MYGSNMSRTPWLHRHRALIFSGCIALLAALCLLLTLPGQSPARAQTNARAILFVWDGTQRNHLIEAYNADELPRLRALVENGGLLRTDLVINTQTCVAGDGDGYDTETGPASSAIVTGYGYPETANQDNLAPNPIPPGYTFFERVKTAHPEVHTGLVSGKNFQFWPTVPLTNAQQTLDFWFQGSVQSHIVANKAIEFLQNHGSSPFFLWVHFRHPDEAGHRYGENSTEYHTQLLEADTQTGRVLDELAALGLQDDTTVLILTDHGFGENTQHHEDCIADNWNIWIASNRAHVIGNMEGPAFQTSVGPTLFDIFGMDKNVSPPFPSQSLWTPSEPPPETPTPSASATPTITPTATPSPTPTATPEAGPPENLSFSPDGGSGTLEQPATLTTVYYNTGGYQDIQYASLLLNVNRSIRQGLFAMYFEDINRFALRSDAGDSWVGFCLPGDATVLSNSYVSLDCSASTATGSDNALTVTWVITPLAPFSGQYGTYTAYLLVQDGAGSRDGWDALGTWTLQE